MGQWDERGPAADVAWSPDTQAPALDSRVELDLPGYRDFVLIARGGESLVYRARQEALDRLVAVKVLRREVDPAPDQASPSGERADSRRWFQRELEITMRLGQAHPNIVTVLDTRLTSAGEPCIVMEYYELGSLHDQLRTHGRLPSSEVVAAGTVVADALAYAHGQGLLHRDVKPHNILVLPTSYVLADFGLARPIDAERSTSLERFSYRHAAPQVLDGELPTAADDVYSLGSTLYTLLDGRPPFAAVASESDSALAYLRRVRTEPPRPISDTDAPAELLSIIERCLSRPREDRFPDAASLRDALASVATEARRWAPGAVHGAVPSAASSGSPPAVTSAPLAPVEPATAPVGSSAPSPAQLARSVLEHLDDASRSGPRDLRSGVQLDPEGADLTAGRPELDRRDVVPSPGWPKFAVRAAIALLIGGILGLAGSWLSGAVGPRGSATGPGAFPTPTGRPLPTYTGPLPIATGSAVVNDPSIAPQITTIDDRGNAVELHWADRSGGKATFVVIQLMGNVAAPIRLVDPGETSVVVDGLDPKAPRYCFQILAVVNDTARGMSALSCTPTRK